MLENESCLLAYRLTCQYLISYTSSDPAVELQKAVEVVQIGKNIEEAGAASWLRRTKAETERALQEVQDANATEFREATTVSGEVIIDEKAGAEEARRMRYHKRPNSR